MINRDIKLFVDLCIAILVVMFVESRLDDAFIYLHSMSVESQLIIATIPAILIVIILGGILLLKKKPIKE